MSEPVASRNRAPARSQTGPSPSPASPETSTTPEYASAIEARSQPNSRASGSTSSPNRYWLVPYDRIVVTPSATTIVQP